MASQTEYDKLLEEHRWITKLIWDKINMVAVANGILFAGLNLLEKERGADNFLYHKLSLSLAAILVTLFFWSALSLDIKHRKNNLQKISQIQKDDHIDDIIRLGKFDLGDFYVNVKYAIIILVLAWSVFILVILTR